MISENNIVLSITNYVVFYLQKKLDQNLFTFMIYLKNSEFALIILREMRVSRPRILEGRSSGFH